MSVTLTWSATNGGTAITDLDHGSGAAGAALTEQTIYLRHDGSSPISQCRFYLAGSGLNAAADLSELLFWGDQNDSINFGGFQLNMDNNGGFPSTWPTYSSKSGTNYNVFRTSVGDSITNGILLPQAMGLSGSAGTIQTGTASGVAFQCRLQIPTTASVGSRQFDQRLRFSYTS